MWMGMRVGEDINAVRSKKYLKESNVGITGTVNPQYCLCTSNADFH